MVFSFHYEAGNELNRFCDFAIKAKKKNIFFFVLTFSRARSDTNESRVRSSLDAPYFHLCATFATFTKSQEPRVVRGF